MAQTSVDETGSRNLKDIIAERSKLENLLFEGVTDLRNLRPRAGLEPILYGQGELDPADEQTLKEQAPLVSRLLKLEDKVNPKTVGRLNSLEKYIHSADALDRELWPLTQGSRGFWQTIEHFRIGDKDSYQLSKDLEPFNGQKIRDILNSAQISQQQLRTIEKWATTKAKDAKRHGKAESLYTMKAIVDLCLAERIIRANSSADLDTERPDYLKDDHIAFLKEEAGKDYMPEEIKQKLLAAAAKGARLLHLKKKK